MTETLLLLFHYLHLKGRGNRSFLSRKHSFVIDETVKAAIAYENEEKSVLSVSPDFWSNSDGQEDMIEKLADLMLETVFSGKKLESESIRELFHDSKI